MLPEFGSRMQPMTLSSVLLPDPLGPRRPITVPGKTSSETSRSASTRVGPSPKCLLMPLTSTTGCSAMTHPASAEAGSILSAVRTPSALASRHTTSTTPNRIAASAGSSTTRRGK